jgi:cation diffusion facilitator family transporter
MKRAEEETIRKERDHAIKKASWVGIIVNLILAILKLVSGVVAGSLAVISDGVDSVTDIFTSLIGLLTVNISSKPADPEHPYGHGRAETIATKALSFIILFAGFQLGISAVQRMVNGTVMVIPPFWIISILGISILSKIGLAFYKTRVGKKASSNMLLADAKNMRNDVLISASTLIGILLTRILKLPILDPIIALGISSFILKTGFSIFLETSNELMDGVDAPELYSEIFKVVHEINGAHNPHRCRIRRINTLYVIDLDIEVEKQLSVEEGHLIATQVEKEIKSTIPHIYDIIVHVEPMGVVHGSERFGLKPDLD